jgi:hypothetical protein
MARFNKAYKQGAQPIPELHYSGITADTTLVVEALDRQCPFQGVLSPVSRSARTDPFMGFSIDYPAFLTLDQMRQAQATGEVYVNGQGPAGSPHAIARSCVKVAPAALPKMDWRYDGQAETYSAEKQLTFQAWGFDSPTFNVEFISVATSEWAMGSMLGELWVTYSDWAADTNGKFRATPKTLATLAADRFVHATAAVDAVSSDRRYPQILISDQKAPVQESMKNGGTVIVQTRGGITSPIVAEIQFCDHREWDVNNQCPLWELLKLNAGQDFLSPRDEINGINGVDRTILFDVYASTSRVYLFTNGVPYGCVDLPAARSPRAPPRSRSATCSTTPAWIWRIGTPTIGRTCRRRPRVTSPNLGFSSNVAAPEWNEKRIPCVAADS